MIAGVSFGLFLKGLSAFGDAVEDTFFSYFEDVPEEGEVYSGMWLSSLFWFALGLAVVNLLDIFERLAFVSRCCFSAFFSYSQ